MTDPVSRAALPWTDLWLLDACRRLGHTRFERADLPESPSAWEALVAAGVPGERVLETACVVANAEPVALGAGDPDELAALLACAVARRYGVVPLRVEGSVLLVACSNPLHPTLPEDLAFAAGHRVRLLVAAPAAIRAEQTRIYPELGPKLASAVPHTSTRGSGGPDSVALLDRVLGEALRQRASDIHMEPGAHGLLVRLRVDGVLYDQLEISREQAGPLVSRLKVLANLDIADRIRPQDGRTSIDFEGRSIDLRISTLPLGGVGEKVVVRLLDAERATVDLAALGFLPAEMHRLTRLLASTEGMLLVTGPTGSGKTTTLYSALPHVQSSEKNVVTVEDPIEYRLEGVNQVQVNERTGLTFASALRSILRQDPDVVLVGEIRDRETAGVAIKASMTGHLVLSTLHTNDAPSAVARLADIGVEMGALSGALKGIMAQRLVRRLCAECSEPIALAELPPDQQVLLAERSCEGLRRPVGCAACRGTGYRGRTVVPEIAVVTPEMQRAIARGASVSELAEMARAAGMRTLWEAGLERVLGGITSLHELLDNVAAPILDSGERSSQDVVDALLSRLLPEATTASALRAITPEVGAAAERVLIVDEDRAARRELRAALEREGFGVLEAADGEAALAYVRRLHPDRIICELVLPRLDGIGLLQALAQLPTAPPALVYTDQRDIALLDWACELGATGVASKADGAGAVLQWLRSADRAAA